MNKKLSNHNVSTLLMFLQQKIEENAAFVADELSKGDSTDFITYPPNGGLTDAEKTALLKLKDDTNLKSALRKILADTSAGVLLELFQVIDGISDPDENLGEWTEISFVDKTDDIAENAEMLHDEFFSSYWDWKKIRPNKGWQLDNFEE